MLWNSTTLPAEMPLFPTPPMLWLVSLTYCIFKSLISLFFLLAAGLQFNNAATQQVYTQAQQAAVLLADPTSLGLSRAIAESRAQLEASSHHMSFDLQLHDILKSEFDKLSTQLHTCSSQTGPAGPSTSAPQGHGDPMISDELACRHSHATDHHIVDCPNAPEEVIPTEVEVISLDGAGAPTN